MPDSMLQVQTVQLGVPDPETDLASREREQGLFTHLFREL